MKIAYLAALAIGAIHHAVAQQPIWSQCGGKDWTGPTTCVSGTYCRKADEWYSQCVPGTATTTASQGSSTLATSTRSTTSTRTSAAPGGTGFPTTSGTKFTIDGKTKYFAGTNSYWISFLSNTADVDKALNEVAASGLKILRVWGFNDVTSNPGSSGVYFQHLSSSGSTINTGSNGLQRLDYLVSAAEARGISLIIPFVNYWDDYGGIAAYVSAFGGSKTSWYTNAAAQTQYKKYIEAVVSRYKSSRAIFAWELANEPRCPGCSTDVIYQWASSTSQYVKSLDSAHMVAIGDEGFGLSGDGTYPYQYTEGLDFVKNLGISSIDFGTLHMYPSHWGTSYDWGNGWIQSHGAACAKAGKPCFLEEYGAPGEHCSRQRPWQKTSVATSGMGGDAFWQLGTTLSSGQTHDDTFTIYVGTSDWQCLVTDHVQAIG
ncbi:fungal cellulose binding domain-containing protein [Sarocladium strictum]